MDTRTNRRGDPATRSELLEILAADYNYFGPPAQPERGVAVAHVTPSSGSRAVRADNRRTASPSPDLVGG